SRLASLGRAPDELRTSTTWNLRTSAGVSFGGASLSIGDSNTEIDIVDFNGDGYPDIISAGVVHFNDGRGGFSDKSISDLGVDGAVREIVNRDVGVNAGAGKSFNLTDTDSETNKIIATNVSAGLDYGLSSSHLDLLDINGDGLPDQVRTDGDRVLV